MVAVRRRFGRALDSVRQLADEAGEIKLARYDPPFGLVDIARTGLS